MTTKTYGVSMKDLQKLRQFQFLLMMKKNFKEFTFNKMDFIAHVQMKWEKFSDPCICTVMISNAVIYLDTNLSLPKSKIYKITLENENGVIIQLKAPFFLGSFVTLNFNNSDQKQNFLETLGNVEDSDSISNEGTLPSTESSSD